MHQYENQNQIKKLQEEFLVIIAMIHELKVQVEVKVYFTHKQKISTCQA